MKSISPEWKIVKPLTKSASYKVIKSKEPDMGTYINSAVGKDKLMRKSMAVLIG